MQEFWTMYTQKLVVWFWWWLWVYWLTLCFFSRFKFLLGGDGSDEPIEQCRNHTCPAGWSRCQGTPENYRCILGKLMVFSVYFLIVANKLLKKIGISAMANKIVGTVGMKCQNVARIARFVVSSSVATGSVFHSDGRVISKTIGTLIFIFISHVGWVFCFSGDRSDEDPNLCKGRYRECSEMEFKCNNGRCILARWRCDQDNDCNCPFSIF